MTAFSRCVLFCDHKRSGTQFLPHRHTDAVELLDVAQFRTRLRCCGVAIGHGERQNAIRRTRNLFGATFTPCALLYPKTAITPYGRLKGKQCTISIRYCAPVSRPPKSPLQLSCHRVRRRMPHGQSRLTICVCAHVAQLSVPDCANQACTSECRGCLSQFNANRTLTSRSATLTVHFPRTKVCRISPGSGLPSRRHARSAQMLFWARVIPYSPESECPPCQNSNSHK